MGKNLVGVCKNCSMECDLAAIVYRVISILLLLLLLMLADFLVLVLMPAAHAATAVGTRKSANIGSQVIEPRAGAA
jgi:hypothetical protein